MNAMRISRNILCLSAAVFVAGATAFACGGPDCSCMTVDQIVAAISATPATGDAQDTDSILASMQLLGDQDFLRDAFETNAVKAELGNMAALKAQNPQLRELAQKMALHHSQLSALVIVPLAAHLGVAAPKEMNKRDKQLVASCAELTGSAFDRQFVNIMTRSQKQDMKKFGNEANATRIAGVKMVAQYGSGMMTRDLKELEQIAASQSTLAQNQPSAMASK